MRRIFLSYFFFILVVLIIMFLLTIPADKYEDNKYRIPHDIRVIKNTAQGAFYFLEKELNELPESQWPEYIAKIDQHFANKISLVELQNLPVNDLDKKEIQNGLVLVNLEPTATNVFYKVSGSSFVIVLNIVGDSNDYSDWFWDIIMIVFLIILALLSLLWAMPFAKRLGRIIDSVSLFGQGQLSSRVTISPRSSLYPLANSFNSMGNRIQKLINSNKVLINAVSHELRTPISRIRLELEMGTDKNNPNSARYLEDIKLDLDELENLISELLLYAKFNTNRPELDIRTFTPQQWLEPVVSKAAAVNQTIKYITNLEIASGTITGDFKLLTIAVSNIVTNASRYANSEVTVSFSQDKENCKVIIIDDGPGIHIEDKSSLFEPFVCLDESRSKKNGGYGGYGLGLAIVKQIVDLHKGNITVESTPEKGSQFAIILPISFSNS